MKWQKKRVPWWAVAAGLIALIIIAVMILQRQHNDLATLERTYDYVNAKRITLQDEQSEKQRELNISTTSDYIASRARENGYMMPNELHFVVQNPEVLTDHESLSQIQLTTVDPQETEPPAEQEADTAAEPSPDPEAQTPATPEETEP